MLQIHEKIKQARVAADLTEAELAKKVGVKRSTYQYWEVKTPGVDKIKRVALALGKHEDYFFGGDEDFVKATTLDEKDKTIADLAYSTRRLADNNTEMIQMLKAATENAGSQTITDVVATVVGLRECIVELAADLKKTSLSEMKAVLGTRVVAAKKRLRKKGNPSDAGR